MKKRKYNIRLILNNSFYLKLYEIVTRFLLLNYNIIIKYDYKILLEKI